MKAFDDPIENRRWPELADYSIIDGPIEKERLRGTVFCVTHRLTELFQVMMTEPITLLSSQFHGMPCSDYNTHKAYFDRAPLNLIERWFARNMMIDHLTVSPLPIGIMVQGIGNKLNIMKASYQARAEKKHFLYVNFEINTNHGEREPAWMNAAKVPGVLIHPGKVHTRSFSDYIDDIRDSKYVLCPPGSGIDTWRFWETLYMGSVPVVQRSPMMEWYSRFFQIVQLDFWEQLTELPERTLNYNSRNVLTFGWWKERIAS